MISQSGVIPYKASIDFVKPVAYDGYHNAFTDLCFWRNQWYLAYRRGQSHRPEVPGSIIVLISRDALEWTFFREFSTEGDDRDPKFHIHADRLYIYWGTYFPQLPYSMTHSLTMSQRILITHAVVTYDGTSWGGPVQIIRPNYWLWSITEEQGLSASIGASYHFSLSDSHSDSFTEIALYKHRPMDSDFSWQKLGTIIDTSCLKRFKEFSLEDTRDLPDLGEPCIWNDGESLFMLVRLGDVYEYGTLFLCSGVSSNGFDEWHAHILPETIHAPAVLGLKPGYALVAGRKFTKVPRTKKPQRYRDKATLQALWLLDYTGEDAVLTELCVLPSRDDCAYPGMAWDVPLQSCYISYYSQHERGDQRFVPRWQLPTPADVYIARIDLQESSDGRTH